MHRTTTTRLWAATGAALVLTLTGCGGSSDESGTAAEPTAASSPSAGDSSTPADVPTLSADASVAGKCAVPSAETLGTFDTAFEGTVTSLGEGTATLSVDRWFTGGEASEVVVDTPSKALEDLLLAVDFQEGRTYLVSSTGGRVTLCGFTAESTPELEQLYAEAFAG